MTSSANLGFDEVHNPFVQRLHWSEVVQQLLWTAGRYFVLFVGVQLTELRDLWRRKFELVEVTRWVHMLLNTIESIGFRSLIRN